MKKHAKTEEPVIEEETGDWNDISCIDCGQRYQLVSGSSNCRCKRCNTLFKINNKMEFHPHAKKN